MQTVRGDTHWQVNAGLVESLLDAGGLKLDAWRQEGRLEVVKDGLHRSVYRLQLPEGGFYIKHYRINDWRALARNLLRPCKAILEVNARTKVAAAGIETFDTIAVGCTRKRGIALDSFLVTRAIDGTQTLHEFILNGSGSSQAPFPFRRNLACRLGELTAQLHRAGLVHQDYHPGNILIRLDEPNNPRLWLVDLHAVVAVRKLDFRTLKRNLSQLNNFFSRFASPVDQFRFFRTYWQCLNRNATGKDFADAARRVAAYCRAVVDEAHRKGDRKWLRVNRRIVLDDRGDCCARGVVEFGRGSVAEFCADSERLFERGQIRFWRRRTARSRLAAVDIATETGLWECYVRSQATPRTTAGFRIPGAWSPLRRAWEIGHAFRRRGLQAPLPLFYSEIRTVAAVRESLVTERIAGVLPLSTFLDHTLVAASRAAREVWLRSSIERIALQIRRMHECRFDHAELTADNLLVASNMTVRDAWILGLDSVTQKTRVTRARVAASLATLNMSLNRVPCIRQTHRLRFLKSYLGRNGESTWKATWKAIVHHSRKQANAENYIASRRTFLAASMGLFATLGAGCQMMGRTEKSVALPTSHCIREEQLLVLSDIRLRKDHPLIVDLTELRGEVAMTLKLPLEKNPVIVYLFSNEKEYRQYLNATYPKLPPRRAYFVGTSTELAVFTYWGDNIQEDLRHEYTHGLLHSCMRHVPLWIDEGLAEYFEVVAKNPARVNADYAHKLGTSLVNGWRPDIRRLEQIQEFSKMQQLDYQESWAWVHFLLHSTPDSRHTLVEYLNDLRTNPQASPLSERLERDIPDVQTRFLAYLGNLPQTGHVAGVL